MSEDGFLKITGRLSRFSKIGGEMVPHVLIEEALERSRRRRRRSSSPSRPWATKSKGEKLVVLHTADEAKSQHAFEALCAKDLPNLFLPKRDQFFKVDAIPILGTGKLDLRAPEADGRRRRERENRSQPHESRPPYLFGRLSLRERFVIVPL